MAILVFLYKFNHIGVVMVSVR